MRYGIDIFSGAGGLSLGAEMAGIKISTFFEIDPHAAKTFLQNNKGAKVLQGDIQEIEPQTLHNDKKPVFVIMGGPPCQGFSLSNTRTRNMDSKKNFLFLELVRFVKEFRPEWFVLVNDLGITNINEGKTQMMIEDCFRAIERLRQYFFINSLALRLWCSPKMNRFFMVGNRLGVDFKFPEKHTVRVWQ